MTEKKKLDSELKLVSPGYESRRRIIVPSHKPQDNVTVVPQLDALMNDALSIIGAELAQYRSKTKRGVTLDLKEARAVQGYLDTMVKLSKEHREAARAADLADLTDEELLQLATQLAKSNGTPRNSAATDATAVKDAQDAPDE